MNQSIKDKRLRYFMKWFILLAMISFFSLAGCQNDSRLEALPSLSPDEGSTRSTAVAEVEPDNVTVDSSPAVEAETPAPTGNMELPTAEIVTDSGMANANVLFVKAQLADDATWTFLVTVEHPDTGWEDYADGWDVVLPDGIVVKPDPESPYTRLLLHPHETEQPFTRNQSGVKIPAGIEQVIVRAHDLVDGFGGKEVVVDLTTESGPDFEVVR
jgi:hypothetical protein